MDKTLHTVDKTLCSTILDLIPQKPPFRFVEDIIEVDKAHAVATCVFSGEEEFYKGHFPGHPVTPGVILIETMAQAGLVVTAINMDLSQGKNPDEIRKKTTLFTLVDEVEFFRVVPPNTRVISRSETVFARRGHLRCRVGLEFENGERICGGLLSGKGVDL